MSMHKLELQTVDHFSPTSNSNTEDMPYVEERDPSNSLQNQAIGRTTVELERIFHELWKVLRFKQQKVQPPMITIQSSGRRRAYGWFARKAWTNGEVKLPEINLSAEHLQRPVVEIVGTLVHEMVHFSNYLAGDRDCSSNNYHNREFKRLAERVLLTCERADDGKNQYGWAYTRPSDALCQIIDELHIDRGVFALYRSIEREFKLAGEASENEHPAEPKLKKWSCGCTNVWSAVEVRAVCVKPQCGCTFRHSFVFRHSDSKANNKSLVPIVIDGDFSRLDARISKLNLST